MLVVFFLCVGVATGRYVEAAAHFSPSPTEAGGRAEFSRLNAQVIRSMAPYRESLERVLGLHEGNVEGLAREVPKWAPLYNKGYLARREVKERERALARAKVEVDQVKAQIEELGQAITEALARE